jgi:nucleoid-associated protein EbfC
MSNPFDMNNMGNLLGGVQDVLQNMQEKAKSTTAEGTAGDGLVTVTVTGECQLASVSIKEEALEDRELLEDLIRAASNEAIRKVREKIAGELGSLAGGLPIPPGILPGF